MFHFYSSLHLPIYSFSMHWLTETLFIEHLYGTGVVWPTKWSVVVKNILNIRDWKLVQIYSLCIISYLFVKIPSITIIKPNIMTRHMSRSRKNSKSLFYFPEVFTFMLILFLTLDFITLPCGIYAPSSRRRANIMLLSKCSRVNIILFLFLSSQ